MKIAVVYNRVSKKVINLFGIPNRERYGLKSIRRIVAALKKGRHQVIALEGDKDLIDNLEDFMPRVLKGERPGLVFNLSYGIQGQARYTHVPGILEMIGIPYVGSGPLAHSLALDKVVAKMIFKQHGLPTPDFTVLDSPDFQPPDLAYPLIVKPKNEAVSFGIRIVDTEEELRDAAGIIFDTFSQPVLVEQYIEGREINVGILGNNPPLAFRPAELIFGAEGPAIYTYEDKTHRSGREVGVLCPAELEESLAATAQTIALKAFRALGCYDCARIDMRLDAGENLYILEINSLPSLGEHGSYVAAAAAEGMDFPALVNALVEVACSRYFGTPIPPHPERKGAGPAAQVFHYLTEHRDLIEKQMEKWLQHSCRTSDLAGRQQAVKELGRRFDDLLLEPVPSLTNNRSVWTWESKKRLAGGTLLIAQLDVPFESNIPRQGFRRDPEWLYGEGIAAVWAPLIMLEFACRSLRAFRRLRRIPLGILCYADEGLDCRYSTETIREAAGRASRVIVLRPGNPGGRFITARRGQRKYFLEVEGIPQRLGRGGREPDILRWLLPWLDRLAGLTSRKKRLAVAVADIRTDSYPMLLPHRVVVTLLTSFSTRKAGDELETAIRGLLANSRLDWDLELISDRPPMRTRRKHNPLLEDLGRLAAGWDIPLQPESSLWPSVAGLVRQGVPVACGMGPCGRDLYTAKEAVERISLVQRTLLLAQYLTDQLQ